MVLQTARALRITQQEIEPAPNRWQCPGPSRAYSAKGRTPEHRSREAQRAAGRSAAGRRSRRPPARSLRDRHHLYSGANELRVLGGEKCRTALLLRGHTTSLSSEVRRARL